MAFSPSSSRRLLAGLLLTFAPGPLPAAAPALPALPPPFALPPPLPLPTPAAIPPAEASRRSAAASAHARWKHEDGGADFHPSLTYLRGTPVLMLITEPGEPGPKTLRRKRAIVQAGAFLLDDTSFERAIVCVVEADGRSAAKPRVRNYDLRRPDFHHTARTAAGAADARQALRQARDADALTLRICADLGID
jgi:hypothetical protein